MYIVIILLGLVLIIIGFIMIIPVFDRTKVIKDYIAFIGSFSILIGSTILITTLLLTTEQSYNSKKYILKTEVYQEYHNNILDNTDTLYVIIPKISLPKK